MTTHDTFSRLCCPLGRNAARWTARVWPDGSDTRACSGTISERVITLALSLLRDELPFTPVGPLTQDRLTELFDIPCIPPIGAVSNEGHLACTLRSLRNISTAFIWTYIRRRCCLDSGKTQSEAFGRSWSARSGEPSGPVKVRRAASG